MSGRYGLEAREIGVAYDIGGDVVGSTEFVAIDRARKVDAGVFAQAEASPTRAVSLTGGLRVDRVAARNTGGFFGDRSVDNTAASGFGAATLGPFGGLSVTAQYALGFRDARLSDRYYRGPTGRGFITGNPDLEPERSRQLDVAVRFTSGPARVAVYLFNYEFDDLIERYEAETDLFFFRNRGSARIRGVELEAQVALGAYAIEIAGHVERGRALDAFGGDLDDIPADSIRVVVRRGIGARGSVFGRIATYADDDRPGPNERFAPGYTLVDLGATWRLSDRVELRGLGRNLLNEAYHASPVRRWVHAPGRNASITSVVTF